MGLAADPVDDCFDAELMSSTTMTKSQLPISNERSTAVVRRLHANGTMIANTKHSYRNGACVRHASINPLSE